MRIKDAVYAAYGMQSSNAECNPNTLVLKGRSLYTTRCLISQSFMNNMGCCSNPEDETTNTLGGTTNNGEGQ